MSAVQFNLLPDIKLHYVKSQRSRNLVISVALLITGISLAIFMLLLFSASVVQKKQLNDANGEITQTANKVKSISNVNKVLTIQNQLNSLASLHKNKHATSRLIVYLPQVTPTDIKISSLTLDFTANTMTINGTAPSQHSVNTFIDTLKFTTYKINDSDQAKNAFPSVVEASFSIVPNNSTYSLTVQFDPTLFAGGTSTAPVLTVPKLTTTRSVTDDPSNPLFNNNSQGH